VSNRCAFWSAAGLSLAFCLFGVSAHLSCRLIWPASPPAPRPVTAPVHGDPFADPDKENRYPERDAVEAALRAGLRAGRDDLDFLSVGVPVSRRAFGEAAVVIGVSYATMNVTVDPFGTLERHQACFLFCRGELVAHFAVTDGRRRP
jgi:hypothetical protein